MTLFRTIATAVVALVAAFGVSVASAGPASAAVSSRACETTAGTHYLHVTHYGSGSTQRITYYNPQLPLHYFNGSGADVTAYSAAGSLGTLRIPEFGASVNVGPTDIRRVTARFYNLVLGQRQYSCTATAYL